MDQNQIPSRNFRKPMHQPLELTSVGLGTFIGAPDDQTDFDIYNAIKLMILSGDARRQRGQNYTFYDICTALKTLVKKYGVERDGLFICTKNGYIPDDADRGIPAATLVEELVDCGKYDVAAGIHCMHPAFLEHQFEQSRRNLGLEAIDLMYLHNAYEAQAMVVGDDKVFFDRLKAAFEFYERKIRSIAKILYYKNYKITLK